MRRKLIRWRYVGLFFAAALLAATIFGGLVSRHAAAQQNTGYFYFYLPSTNDTFTFTLGTDTRTLTVADGGKVIPTKDGSILTSWGNWASNTVYKVCSKNLNACLNIKALPETLAQDPANITDWRKVGTQPKLDQPPAGKVCPDGTTWNVPSQKCFSRPVNGKCPTGFYKVAGNQENGGDYCLGDPIDDVSGDTSTDPTLNCEILNANPLNWVICPIVDGLQTAVNKVNAAIDSMLTVDTDQAFNDNFHKAWSNFRTFAMALVVIAVLIMVIAQAAGLEVLDAYTFRKTIPRLVLVAILIPLSWPLLKYLVLMTNEIGNSIRWVIYQPFSGLQGTFSLTTSTKLVGVLVAGAALATLGIMALLSYVATAALAVGIAFIVLIIRQLIVMLLIIISPLAIAFYALENTRKFGNFARDTFISMMVAFPIIEAFIATGRVFALVAYNSSDSPSMISQVTAFIAFFIPYFALPFAFRLAGGTIATIAGLANDRSRGGFDRLKNFRKNRTAQNLHDMKTGNRMKGGGIVARGFNAATRNAANLPNAGLTPWKMRSRMQAASATHEQQELAEYMDKNAAFGAIKGNDDYLQATMKNMGGGHNESDWRRYLQRQGYSGRSLEQGVAQIRAAKRGVSNEVFEKAAVMANASTGTGWKEGGAGQMMESINEAAGNDRHTAATMLAQMRGMASQSGRLDLAGSGFGTQVAALEKMHSGGMSAVEANKAVAKGALFTKDPGSFARARGQAVQNLAPHMLDNLKDAHRQVEVAHKSGDAQQIYESERALAQEYAALDNLHTSLTHTAPENARIIADSVLRKAVGQTEDGKVITVMDNIKRIQGGDPNSTITRAFHETTKTYGGAEDAARRGQIPEAEE